MEDSYIVALIAFMFGMINIYPIKKGSVLGLVLSVGVGVLSMLGVQYILAQNLF